MITLLACVQSSDECQHVLDLHLMPIGAHQMSIRWSSPSDSTAAPILYRSIGDEEFQKIATLTPDVDRYTDMQSPWQEKSIRYKLILNSGQNKYCEEICSAGTLSDEAYAMDLHLPGSGTEEPMPLLIFLHGSGERGHDLELVRKHGPLKLIDAGQQIPMIIAAPQCPTNRSWEVNRLNANLDDLLSQHLIDSSRIYITGLSMGGYGTWQWLSSRPEIFAAAVPICGWSSPAIAPAIKDIPIWAFHGAKDLVVPLAGSGNIIDALKQLGANPKFSVYPEAGHDSWTAAYETEELWAWLAAQKK